MLRIGRALGSKVRLGVTCSASHGTTVSLSFRRAGIRPSPTRIQVWVHILPGPPAGRRRHFRRVIFFDVTALKQNGWLGNNSVVFVTALNTLYPLKMVACFPHFLQFHCSLFETSYGHGRIWTTVFLITDITVIAVV